MTYNKFKTQFKNRVINDMPDSKKIVLKTSKEYGKKHDILVVSNKKDEETGTVARNELDLTDVYHTMTENKIPFAEIYDALMKDYLRADKHAETIQEGFTGSIESFDNAKAHITSKLILKKWCDNKALKQVPHIGFLDMERIFILIHGGVSTVINNELKKDWGITDDELIEAANKNVPEPILEDIKEFSLDKEKEDNENLAAGFIEIDKDKIDIKPVYVLTGDPGAFGSSCIAKPDVIKDAAEKLESDLYVLPVIPTYAIVYPAKHGMRDADKRVLDTLINDINAEMSFENWISDHAYYYSREKGWLA